MLPNYSSKILPCLLSVREHVRLEVGGLGKSLVAAVKRAHIRPVSCVDADVSPQIEV